MGEEFEKNLYRELEKYGKGLGRASGLDSRTACNINNINETIATLFSDTSTDLTPGILICLTVCDLTLTVKCEDNARFCDLATVLTEQLIDAGHIKMCIEKGHLVLANPMVAPKVRYSMEEFRIIQTEQAPHFHRVVWLKAEFDSPRKEESPTATPKRTSSASTTPRSTAGNDKPEGRL